MTKEQYMRLTAPYRENPKRTQQVDLANKCMTGIVFAAYPMILLELFLTGSSQLVRAVLVPLIGFIAVSLFRNVVNRRRPYEAFDLPPVIKKDTKGKSFPSRHVFSAAVIAATVFALEGMQAIGVLLLVMALGLSVIRVITGVHYPEDCMAGFMIGIGIAWVGFYLM